MLQAATDRFVTPRATSDAPISAYSTDTTDRVARVLISTSSI